jgi:TrmH family RNA methyltransferase
MPVAREVELEAVAGRVRANRGEVWAADTSGERMERWRPRRPLLLVVGAEGIGVSEESLALANGQVAIPLERGIDSLNVAVAAGILLNHLRLVP